MLTVLPSLTQVSPDTQYPVLSLGQKQMFSHRPLLFKPLRSTLGVLHIVSQYKNQLYDSAQHTGKIVVFVFFFKN